MPNYALPVEYDPVRRFVAAYTLYAVRDYLSPRSKLGQKHRRTAAEFCQSPEGRQLIKMFVPREDRIVDLLGELE